MGTRYRPTRPRPGSWTPRTAFPIGLLTLQREACWVDYAERQLRSLGCTVLGTLVDGVFLEERYRELVLERLVRGEHRNGVTFDLKDEPACKVPTCQQRRPNNSRGPNAS